MKKTLPPEEKVACGSRWLQLAGLGAQPEIGKTFSWAGIEVDCFSTRKGGFAERAVVVWDGWRPASEGRIA